MSSLGESICTVIRATCFRTFNSDGVVAVDIDDFDLYTVASSPRTFTCLAQGPEITHES